MDGFGIAKGPRAVETSQVIRWQRLFNGGYFQPKAHPWWNLQNDICMTERLKFLLSKSLAQIKVRAFM